jgi:hypothetical protein
MGVQKKTYRVTHDAVEDVRETHVLGFHHHLSVSSISQFGPPPSGTLTIELRAPGSAVFEPIQGVEPIDLAAPEAIQVIGAIAAFRFTCTDVPEGTKITLTDTIEV